MHLSRSHIDRFDGSSGHRAGRFGLASAVLISALMASPAMASEAVPLAAPAAVDAPTGPTTGTRALPGVTEKDRLAAEAADPQGQLPEEAKDLRIDEKVGHTVPLDIPFIDTEGKAVTLTDYLDGDLPVILTFNYSSCPMLCNSQLRGLVEGMDQLVFEAGQQYRVVTIAIDHLETPATAKDTRERYLELFPEDKRAGVRRGWSFLTGKEDDIRKFADSVGFPFRYVEEYKEYAHPASLIFLSPKGIVTRYYHGIYYEPKELSQSIFKAGVGEHGVSVGFLYACLRPSHKEGYAKAGENAMRYGGIGFVVLLLAAFGTWQMMRARSARQEQTCQEQNR